MTVSASEEIVFRPAKNEDQQDIWEILKAAIRRRGEEGSEQWQNGYPNPGSIAQDIAAGAGFVLISGEKILGYAAVIENDEPAYRQIQGKWLSEGDFIVVHRVAIAEEALGRGLSLLIFRNVEKQALERGIHSVKVDTNFDNAPMLRILEVLGYSYCGEVLQHGNPRKAFEKLLK